MWRGNVAAAFEIEPRVVFAKKERTKCLPSFLGRSIFYQADPILRARARHLWTFLSRNIFNVSAPCMRTSFLPTIRARVSLSLLFIFLIAELERTQHVPRNRFDGYVQISPQVADSFRNRYKSKLFRSEFIFKEKWLPLIDFSFKVFRGRASISIDIERKTKSKSS